MNLLAAMTLVVGVLAALVTWLFTGPVLSGLGLSLWAVFLGWASFFNQGGGEEGLKKSVFGALWGTIVGTIAFVLYNSGLFGGLGDLAFTAIVGITAALLVAGSIVPVFSAIPAGFYGYAATAAFAFLGNHVGDALSMNFATMPFLNIFTSMLIGALFGYVSEKLIGALAAKAPA